MKETIQELNTALEQGIVLNDEPLPRIFVENFRLVDDSTKGAGAMQKYLAGIAQKLLPDHDFDAHPVKFVLSDDETENAFAITHANQTIIGMNKGFIQACRNEDELVYVLGHELKHVRLAIELGEGSNSKTEEALADMEPVLWMHKAGWQPEAALDLTARYADERLKSGKPFWEDLADVHPLSHNRTDAVAKTLAVYGQKVGGFENRQVKPLPKALLEYVGSANHTSYYEQKFKDAGFDAMPPLEQIKFLHKEIVSLPPGYEARMKDLYVGIQSVKSGKTPDERAVLDRLVSHLIKNPPHFKALYPAVARNLYGLSYDTPVGELAAVARNVRDFIEADNIKDAEHYARRMFRGYDTANIREINNLGTQGPIVKWPQFAFPSPEELTTPEAKKQMRDEGIPLPWNRHVKWCRDKLAEGDSTLLKAMYAAGALDERLIEMTPFPEINDQVESELYQANPNSKRFSRFPPHLEFCRIEYPQGAIIAYSGPNISFLSTDMFGSTYDEQRQWHPADYMDASIRQKQRAYLESQAKTTIRTGEKQYAPHVAMLIFLDATDEELAEHLNGKYVQENAPFFELPDSMALEQLKAQALLIYDDRWSVLLNRFDRMLAQDREKYAPAIREFFYNGANRFLPGSGRELAIVAPVGRFLLADKHRIFSHGKRGWILNEHFAFSGLSALITSKSRISTAHLIKWTRDVLGYQKPVDAFAHLEAIGGLSDDQNLVVLQSILNYELGKYLSTHAPGTIDMAHFILNYPDCATHYEDHEGDYLVNLFKTHIVAQKKWPSNPDERIAIYRVLDANNVFPSEEFRTSYATGMEKSIRSVRNLTQRLALCEKLLGDGLIRDPDVRESTVSLWVDTQTRLLGLDTGDEAYKAKTDAVLSRVNKMNIHVGVLYTMLSRLAEGIEAQRDVSYSFRDKFFKYSRLDLQKAHIQIVGGEAGMKLLSRTSSTRKATLNFLMHPLSDEKARQEITDIIEENSVQFLDDIAKINVDELSENDQGDGFAHMVSRRIHENFWKAPMPVRTLIIDQLLIPSEHRDYTNKKIDENFSDAFKFVMDELLSPEMKYAKEARQVLKSYSEILPHYARSLLLSSMLSADERAKQSGKSLSVGERLAIILELMGPAERKFGQAIHSYPSTPEDMKADMKRLKSMAAIPTRWELFERYEAAVPESYRQEKKRLGSVKGAASFMISVPAEAMDGTQTVINIQRENALAQAEYGFSQLEALAEKLNHEETDMAHVIAPMIDMIRHARSKAAIETDGEYGAKQVALAHDIYNGTTITVGAHSFTFKSAPWIAYGAEFRDQEMMPGEHFSDLPEKTQEQKDYKKAAAKAHVTMEFMNILSGSPLDDDRHGAQCRVSDHQFGLFDHGALELDAPGKADKQMLAASLVNGFQGLSQGRLLSDIMYEEINNHKTVSGELPHYLMQVQRSLLALNDFFHFNTKKQTPDAKEPILNTDDVLDIMKSIYQAQKVDPAIIDTIKEMAFSGRIPMSYAFMLAAPAKNPVFIRQENPGEYKPPRFIPNGKTNDAAPVVLQKSDDEDYGPGSLSSLRDEPDVNAFTQLSQ